MYKNKDTQREWMKNWRLKNKEKVRKYNLDYKLSHKKESKDYMDSWRSKNPDKLNAQRKRQRIKNAEKIRKYSASYRIKNMDKKRAHALVRVHILKGDLVREKCVECGSEKTQAHHPDYSKPLEVIWLCPSHHKKLHLKSK